MALRQVATGFCAGIVFLLGGLLVTTKDLRANQGSFLAANECGEPPFDANSMAECINGLLKVTDWQSAVWELANYDDVEVTELSKTNLEFIEDKVRCVEPPWLLVSITTSTSIVGSTEHRGVICETLDGPRWHFITNATVSL